jgi:rubrerythrin
MNNNTKVRIRLTKQLFESLSKQVIAEAKQNFGAGMEVIKAPKGSTEPKAPKAPSAPKAPKAPSHKETDANQVYEAPVNEANNPEVDKIVKTLVNKMTKHFGHNDHRATIGAIRAALDRLEKKKPEGGEDE